jgi:hypothetical protein
MHGQIFLSFQLWRCNQKTPQSSLLLSLGWQLVKFGRGEMALEFDSYPRISKVTSCDYLSVFCRYFHVIRHNKSAKLKYLLG